MHITSVNNDTGDAWTFDFWENSAGSCVVANDFLDDLERRDPSLHTGLFERMSRVTQYPISNQLANGDLEKIDSGLYEFKFHLKDEIRFLGHVSYEGSTATFYVFCAFKKKDRRLREKALRLAHERYSEFKLMKEHI